MRIAIDISQIVYGTGVSTYTKRLITELVKLDRKNSYTLFGGSLRQKKTLSEFVRSVRAKNVNGMVVSFPPALADFLWNSLHMYPVESLLGPLDVFHSSDWTQPATNAYKVTTVHDLAPLKFPEETPSKIRKVHERRLALVKRECDAVIVPSTQTKSDLIEMGIAEDKIHVIYEAAGLSAPFPAKSLQEKIRKLYSLTNDYVITVGVTKRKNTARLMKAFERVHKATGLDLVLVGRPVEVEIPDVPYIKSLGYVSDEELVSLLAGASSFVYPSLYEGFGIPILDAMKYKVPIVTSNVGSMKEIAGSAARLVDPSDTKSIAEGILDALSGSERLIKTGTKREKEFSWTKLAQETLSVYEGAVAKAE